VQQYSNITFLFLLFSMCEGLSPLTPALISLHWLHIPERIYFKLSVMTYRCVHGTSPSYPVSCFTRVSDMTSRFLTMAVVFYLTSSGRSAVRLSTVGSRAFPVSGATVWNDLPLYVTSAPSLAVFRQRLKTFFFPFLQRHII